MDPWNGFVSGKRSIFYNFSVFLIDSYKKKIPVLPAQYIL